MNLKIKHLKLETKIFKIQSAEYIGRSVSNLKIGYVLLIDYIVSYFYQYNICLQIFVTFAINLSALPIGTNISLTGILLSRLRESENDIQLTKDEESWFGNEINLNIPDENYNIVLIYETLIGNKFYIIIFDMFQQVYTC